MSNENKKENEQAPGMALALVVLMAGCALGIVGYGLTQTVAVEYPRFLALLAICLVASRLKVSLPGIPGTMSVNCPFLLLSAASLSLLEAMIVVIASALVQSLWKAKQHPRPLQIVFNVSTLATALALAHMVFTPGLDNRTMASTALALAAAATTFFFVNTVPTALIIGLTEHMNPAKVWNEVCLWSFPYFLASAGVASMVLSIVQSVGWKAPLALLPLMYMVYRSYTSFLGQPQMALQAAAVSNQLATVRGRDLQASLENSR